MDPNNFITPGILAQNVANGRCGNSSGFFQVEAKTILVILVRNIIAVTCWNRLGYQQYFGQNVSDIIYHPIKGKSDHVGWSGQRSRCFMQFVSNCWVTKGQHFRRNYQR